MKSCSLISPLNRVNAPEHTRRLYTLLQAVGARSTSRHASLRWEMELLILLRDQGKKIFVSMCERAICERALALDRVQTEIQLHNSFSRRKRIKKMKNTYRYSI